MDTSYLNVMALHEHTHHQTSNYYFFSISRFSYIRSRMDNSTNANNMQYHTFNSIFSHLRNYIDIPTMFTCCRRVCMYI